LVEGLEAGEQEIQRGKDFIALGGKVGDGFFKEVGAAQAP
jgi:hypothetical protein